ncbi:ATP-dependent RecD-like DNA helicase [Porphyromonas sp. COT-290 OH3588]|uniref:ATP-dependent DNA helicase n=1 Tax=Porphyromonas sp. COT-290 OH3588 TaxID=1515617 RepID=UPI00052E2F1B|nr:AAA family ATPase [Porphyromonas sp. COT-290 OH3588]KGN97832.1 helicase [Porphyromonas sp. COT-290 OH3588]
MMYNLIEQQILQKLGLSPTSGQEEAIASCAAFLANPAPYSIFLLKGYAGTGKTFLLNAIASAAEEAGMQVELMATTGRAAKVLEQATGRITTTIHRRIYRSTAASIEEGGGYKLASHKGASTLFIVDEASMISGAANEPTPFGSGNLLDDLLAYVAEADGCKLILVGDTAQLPPVGSELSDALNATQLERQYGVKIYEAELTEVVRQAESSGILGLATYLRQLLASHASTPSGESIQLKLDISAYHDVEVITGVELVDTLDGAYRRYGREECLVIAPSNKRALTFNLGIRAQVLDYDEEVVRGEGLIVARNNYHYTKRRDRSDFIANGELIELRRLHRQTELYGLRFADATIYLPDREDELEVKLLLTGLADEQAQRTHQQRTALYQALLEDYSHHSSVMDLRRAIRQDPYWGALEVKYGYAVTAHKAQGGQWPCVFIDLGLMKLLPTDLNMIRWLYTAITRATEQVYLVNPPEEFIVS